ncbi:hypothetical protein EUTSA_v10022909mg [Eutrema salsugineum]|uniref:TIR domain-containing protein n=1 Tax=Eutrema salsugineum TaxID=72664 RepID=V4M7E2_EUTSA|nr:hypothetical protein EUTSA_v10022909mg [Eutrema salsugineum]
MDSSFFLTILVAAISFFMLLVTILFLFYKKFRFHQANITIASSLALSSPPSSFPHNQKYHVFSSFHGPDVRKTFLRHILKEFKIKGINPFIDNHIERSKPIDQRCNQRIQDCNYLALEELCFFHIVY